MTRRTICLFLWLACMAGPAAAQYYDDFGGDAPYVPTPPAVVEAMLKLGRIQPEDFVIDLGCGDGRIVVAAAAKFGARGMGYDLNPERIAEANANAKQAGVSDRVKFVDELSTGWIGSRASGGGMV